MLLICDCAVKTSPEQNPRLSSPSDAVLLLLEGVIVFPGQREYVIPQSSGGIQRKVVRKDPNQMSEPPRLTCFNVEQQQLYSWLLPYDEALQPL